ncbi:hypothetical protein ILUMI_06976 [Ignelater luminosus]|uniref:Disintegrin and metalloproteinase domain-containing protein 12 n=1 Tax=Ignelater luminosus TaxID=2038154 RepID=A0A8K0GGQ6_IGNLU|nr:hypothetical protein ILUMI_06976 [Ignelater luminosus]
MHYLQKASNNDNLHFLYKHSDLVDNNKTCGYDDNYKQQIKKDHEFNRILRYKRAAEATGNVKGPYNANRQSRYVELVLVVDNAEYKEVGESKSKVEHHCKTIANIINGLYAPLNIFIALVGIVIWNEHDEVNFSANGDTTLTNFLHYRREKLIKEHPNDNAQLLTKVTFDHGVVGKALKGPICTIEYSGGVNTDHSSVVGLVATTVAHEMGHNFGMEHDTNECECPEERCIMAPSSSSAPPSHWSSCSLEYLALAFEHGMDYCLRNKPESLFDSPVCGNGFVEPGEQCDCGLPEHCDNTCCNATICMLYSNATCATGECCDLQSCRPKTAGTVCRSAEYECDLPEYCTGQSEYCPADIYKRDTEMCDGGKAYCYKGFCRTQSDQCKLLWGETGRSSDDQCYLYNTKGSRHGNCGYNKLNQSFFKCKDEDVFCGMLHCKHLNERLEFGMESVAILSQTFINVKGSVVPCRTALVDLGINQIDPGLVPDGAKCGESKMCVNQKCMSVESLRAAGLTCPNNCNNNGICNSLGHCHCKDGFAPPLCDYPGFGGSEDSGPTTDPDAGKEFVTAMFIIFLGIIPACAILGFLMYYVKHNLQLTWKKPSSSTKKSPSKPRGPSPFQPSSPPKCTEDNHSLLQDQTSVPAGFKTEFFGNFKGFSITPLKALEPEPIRAAPPVPIPPPAVVRSPNVNRSNTSVTDKINPLNKTVFRSQSTKPVTSSIDSSVPPALPPLNPGSHPRPIISSPILENSTCTAKELMSPLRNAPKIPLRPAPTAPNENKRPLSSPDTIIATIIPEAEKKPIKENNTALNRIASFLKPEKKVQHNTNTLSKNSTQGIKAAKALDKNSLRSIEISNPIPQTDIAVPSTSVTVDVTENKPVVMRAQSMRGGNVTQRPVIPNFGSMRHPNGFKRPVSIPSANRPKSPPPPRPPLAEIHKETPGAVKVPTLPGYQKPPGPDECKQKQNQYDDCLNETTALSKIKEEKESMPIVDNIYAVIDETPIHSSVNSPESDISKIKSSSGSSESVGLLGEIVSEIQNRNVDSIYSTSTLSRKKKEEMEAKNKEGKINDNPSEIYVNTSSMYKVPENVYSNMNNIKSSASSTSSGYINPSLVNPPLKTGTNNSSDKTVTKNIEKAGSNAQKNITSPVASPPITTVKPTLSTFKGDQKSNTANTSKPYSSLLERRSGPLASTFKTNNSTKDSNETAKTNNKTPPSPTTKTAKPLKRQTTPPNMGTKKPSTVKTTAPPLKTIEKPLKPTSNSPDLVTSCSNNNTNMENNAKSPDVLNSGPMVMRKPNLPKTVVSKVNKNLKSPTDKETLNTTAKTTPAGTKTITAGTKIAARQNSNVATLQQKFENKPPISVKSAVPTKK